jgi:tellurite resistance protein
VGAVVFAATLLRVAYVAVASVRLLARGTYFPAAPAAAMGRAA